MSNHKLRFDHYFNILTCKMGLQDTEKQFLMGGKLMAMLINDSGFVELNEMELKSPGFRVLTSCNIPDG